MHEEHGSEASTNDAVDGVLGVARKRLEQALMTLSAEVEANTTLLHARETDLLGARDTITMLEEDLSRKSSELEQLTETLAAVKIEQESQQQAGAIDQAELEGEREARISAEENAAALRDRIAKLEQENLGLHQQIAQHSLGEPKGDAESRAHIASLEAEKKSLTDRFEKLKVDFIRMEARAAGASNDDTPVGQSENDSFNELGAQVERLESQIEKLESERDALREGLDKSITEIDAILSREAS